MSIKQMKIISINWYQSIAHTLTGEPITMQKFERITIGCKFFEMQIRWLIFGEQSKTCKIEMMSHLK